MPHYAFTVSINGWKPDKINQKWLGHFGSHLKKHTKGIQGLLLIDSHEVYNSFHLSR